MRNELSIWGGNTMNSFFELQRNVDRMFDQFFQGPAPTTAKSGESWFSPACDVRETETHYVLVLDAPGIRKDDLKIELKGNQLHVSGRRRRGDENTAGQTHLVERRYGQFDRVFTLPDAIEAERIEAEYRDGVLAVAVPKAEAAKPRQIPIGSPSAKPGFLSKLMGQETGAKGDNKVA